MFSECAENEDETELLFTHLQQQLAVIHNCSLSTNDSDSARNLGFISDNHLIFCDQISALSRSFYYHNRKLHCIRHYLDFKTASFMATSVAHSKLLCTTAFQKSQVSRFQVIQNSFTWAPVKAPKFCHVIPVVKLLHQLKINERIEYDQTLSYLQSS